MSAHKEDRWQSTEFTREIGDYSLRVEFDGVVWSWCVLNDMTLEAKGFADDEKAAKLAARRVTERCLVRDAKDGAKSK